ncbi:transposase [Streptomyces sp. NPDC001340]
MSDAAWVVVRPLLPVPGRLRGRGGQPEAYCHRAMLDAIRYLVDNGTKWRAMPALHTALYAELCQRLGGDFVHHYPGWDPTIYDPPILDRTREKIAELGWEADPELWGPPSDETLVSVAANCQHAPECTIRPMPKPEPPVG